MIRTPRWLVFQRWERLLFAHWRADPDRLARVLPHGVQPDLYGGTAWVAVVAFVMEATRAPFGPRWRGLAPIPELNVRTYVRVGGVPGVWFLSLDATSPLFVSMGRALYGLRYALAKMTTATDGERVHYVSAGAGRAFAASYAPTGAVRPAQEGTLERFLVERYRLFSERRGRLLTATVEHEPWPLQPAQARIHLNTMAPPGVALEGLPLVNYSHSVSARISAPESLDGASVSQLAPTTRPHLRRRDAPRARSSAEQRPVRVPADAS